MNCQELQQDIEKLTKLKNTLQEKVEKANNTGTVNKMEMNSIQQEITETSDSILEKYLDDFYDKNPELLKIELGKRIKGVENADGDYASINTIAPLPNGNILIGGSYGALYEYCKQPDDSYQLGERIEGFRNENNGNAWVNVIAPLPNGNMLIGGGDMYGIRGGALYEYRKQPDDSYQLSERIEGFKDADGYYACIRAIAPLPNGNMLIGGSLGALYEYCKQPDGSYKLSERIEGVERADGDDAFINTIAPLPNG